MAKVVNELNKIDQEIFKGDLVLCKGNYGIFCEDKDENYSIYSLNGNCLMEYGRSISAIDKDDNVQLLCSSNDLVITLSKQGAK